MPERAHITPQVLRWARETAKMSIPSVSLKLPCKPDKLESWERGDDFPTIKQAEKLAKMYRRPLALLFLPEIPREFQPLQDFRRRKPAENSSALVFMMREIRERQAWLHDELAMNREPVVSFVGKMNRRSAPAAVAKDIRNSLGIDATQVRKHPLKFWIQRAEANRVFVSLSSNVHSRLLLDPDEVSGFAIADEYAPFIFINSRDYENAQLFTLVHELAHLWINESGISNETTIEFRERRNLRFDPVEQFCNEVAANALMPTEEIAEMFRGLSPMSLDDVTQIAKRLGVSTFALLIRLKTLEMITTQLFRVLWVGSEKQFEEYKRLRQEREGVSEGAPDWYRLQLRRNGRAFTHIVFDLYRGGRLTGAEASHLLNVKLNNFAKMERIAFQ